MLTTVRSSTTISWATPSSASTAQRSGSDGVRVWVIINSLIENYLHPIRHDGSPGCDTSEHPSTGKRRARGNAEDRLPTPARRTSPTAIEWGLTALADNALAFFRNADRDVTRYASRRRRPRGTTLMR